MADCTHTLKPRSAARLLLQAAVCTAILLLAALGPAAPAFADGDPASDILISQTLFLPQDAGVQASRQAQLEALLRTAQRAGYPIRVALIASRADLGSVTELWHQPQSYAQFLAQELALVYRGPVLVVMPGGFGLYQAHATLARERAVLGGMPAPAPTSELGTVTLTAVQRLAAASGHALPSPAATAAPKSSSSDVVVWIVFAIGGALIALAWGASLRARPLVARRGARAGSHAAISIDEPRWRR